jgi:hypothetical protein
MRNILDGFTEVSEAKVKKLLLPAGFDGHLTPAGAPGYPLGNAW